MAHLFGDAPKQITGEMILQERVQFTDRGDPDRNSRLGVWEQRQSQFPGDPGPCLRLFSSSANTASAIAGGEFVMHAA